jgi:bifunctional enzyme CysN/CysC
VVTGHVDHGKSTVLGRLLVDTGSVPSSKLESIRADCARGARSLEYAFFIDALKEEHAQGITIDAARVFFKSAHREYVLIDAPGHVEFLRNMITGASRAQAAVVVIDAVQGAEENSRRHGYLLRLLAIHQVIVLINKMDLVDFRQDRFDRVRDQYADFLAKVGAPAVSFLPVSGRTGDNIAARSASTPWHQGPTFLEALDALTADAPPVDRPFRMPVQAVYKFTAGRDDRRIVAGSVESGRVHVGHDVVFYPSGKRARVRSIEAFNRPPQTEAIVPQATGFTLEEQIFVSRGELAARADEPAPEVSTRFRVSLFWLGRSALLPGKEYVLRLATARVSAQVERIERVIDASDLSSSIAPSRAERHQIAECLVVTSSPIAFDSAAACTATSRFVLVDDYEIRGGGIICEALTDSQTGIRATVFRRNLKWAASGVPEERRAERFSQRPALLMITGDGEVDRKRLARALEVQLFEDGRLVYFLAIGNVLYGVDADLDRTSDNRSEHLRRLSEVINILLDAGMIVIATSAALTQRELEAVRTAVGPERVSAVWVGDRITTDLAPDLGLSDAQATTDGAARLKAFLQSVGIIFRPW